MSTTAPPPSPATLPAPTGEQVELVAGRYRAVVTQVGAGLRALSADGRDLVVGFDADEERPRYRGSVLVPWPNRVGDGVYTWDGRTQQLALTEPDRGNALHGLVCWQAFDVVARTASTAVLTTRVWPQQGWPHLLDVEVAYVLTDAPGTAQDGLTWTVTTRNAGSGPAPYGTSIHPYLVGGPGRVDDWTLELDASRILDVDPERLLPAGVVDVPEHRDFRRGRALAGVFVDHALTGVAADATGTASARVLGADGRGVSIHWDPRACPWVQVHTGDRPEPEQHRLGLACEPMTCAPDALRTGTDLLRLDPGTAHTTTWRIAAVDA